jgi:hypothetical protein
MKTWSNLGVPSTEGPTGNLVWVDQVNGNDSLAVRGRMSVPFRTLTAAKNAAKAGDTIMVMPGVYGERNLAKNGVNWHFLTGAEVRYDGFGSGGIFDTALVGSSCTFKVSGSGIFELILESATSSVVHLAYSGDNVMVECDEVTCAPGSAVSSVGALRIRCRSIWSGPADAVYISGSGTTQLHAREVTSTGGHAIRIDGGSNDVDAWRIVSSGGNGVHVTSGSAFIRAFEINSSAGYGLEFAGDYDPTVIVQGARLISTLASSNGKAVYASAGSSGLRLSSCTLISHASASYGIDAGGSFTVQLHGACTSNKQKSGNITTLPTTQSPNMYSYDANVS